MLNKIIKKLITLLTLSSILLPQFTLAVNSHTTDLELTSSQGFTLADSADFGWGTNSTISWWVNFESIPGEGVFQTFLAQSIANQRWGQLQFMLEGGVEKFVWHSYNHCSDTGLAETNARINYDVTVGTWYHVAYVQTGTTWELFINGVSQGTTTIDDSENCSADWWLGFDQGTNQEFDGKLDDFRIYPTTALTATQILADYNCELTDYTNLTVYYQFNNSANEVVGVGASTDNLTAVNTPTYQTADLPFTAACAAAGGVAAPIHPFIWNLF